MPKNLTHSIARWIARIICTAFFLVIMPLYLGHGRPKWELLTWFETFALVMIAILLALCVMAWVWPRLAGWIMLICLTVFYALMLYEIGKLDVWFVGILYIPALFLLYAGKAGPRGPKAAPSPEE